MIEVYVKDSYGERVDLSSVFAQEIAEKIDLKYCHADIIFEFKEYHIKNIPFVLLKDFGTLRLEAYLIDIIGFYAERDKGFLDSQQVIRLQVARLLAKQLISDI